MFMLLLFTIVPNQVSAYTGGLMNGKPMIREDTGAIVRTLTDNDPSTYENLYDYNRTKAFVYYDFPEPMHITHYQLDITQTSYETLTFLDANNKALLSLGASTLSQSGKTAVNVTNVSKVRIRSSSSNSVYLREMDVWGYGEASGPPAPPDETPPAAPTGLTGTAGDKQVTLRWNSNSEADFQAYRVYRGSTLWGTVSTSTAVVTGLTNDAAYDFYVTAVDKTGNESAKSTTLSLTPKGPPPPDTTPPAVPKLTGKPGTKQAILTWTRSPDADLSGYKLYQDGKIVGTYTSLSATVSDLQNGKAYAYQVTAFDASGNESAKSNVVTLTPNNRIDVMLIPNGDSIVVQITGGSKPYVVNWGAAQKTVDDSQYVIPDLQFDTTYTISVTDAGDLTYTQQVNTGTKKGFIPPTMPNPQQLFQRLLDIFGTAGIIALAVIGGAVGLGLMIVLARWGWRLVKGWLAKAK